MLTRELRPNNLSDVLGNEPIKKSIESLFRLNRNAMPHTFMFCGPSGCGKTTLARILADMLECTELGLFELNAANTRSVDDVREIANNAPTMPLDGKAKVYIIDESHQLTNTAQQCLLKITEDCPKHVYFIFCTTEPQNLIKPLLNRCTRYDVNVIREREIYKWLQLICEDNKFNVDDDVLDAIAYVADGSPREALNNLEKVKGLTDTKEITDLLYVGSEKDENVFNLAALLCAKPDKRMQKWRTILDVLDNIDTDSEVTRKSLLGVIRKKLMNCENDQIEIAKRYSYIMNELTKSTFYGGKNELTAIVAKIIFNGEF